MRPFTKSEPSTGSLQTKFEQAYREHLDLILRLTGNQIDRATLTRALELDIIDQIAVRNERVDNRESGSSDGNNDDGGGSSGSFSRDSTSSVIAISFALRMPRPANMRNGEDQ